MDRITHGIIQSTARFIRKINMIAISYSAESDIISLLLYHNYDAYMPASLLQFCISIISFT